ncbi:MAG: FliH/SctL family protein [Mariprofundales bacterium]|nr:FliH/SctL family protein [Mariprofundales bacterium]
MTTPLQPLPIQKVERDGEPIVHQPFFPPLDKQPPPAAPAVFTTLLSATKSEPAEEETTLPDPSTPPPPSETEMRIIQLERMLQEAKAHAEQQESEAYNRAYANGEKAGIALAKERAEATIDQFDRMIQQARQQMLHIQHSTADAIIDIAQMITESLIGELHGEQREWLVNAAAKVAANLPVPPSSLQLAVNPEDLADIKKIVDDEQREWQIIPDSTLSTGCCRLISQQQDAFIDPLHAVAELVRTIRPELQASIHPNA